MEGFRAIKDNRRYPLGITPVEGGMHFSVVWEGESCRLILFGKQGKEEIAQVDFSCGERTGDVWNLTVAGEFKDISYCYEMDGKRQEDPYGIRFYGREKWGSEKSLGKVLPAAAITPEYDWEGDLQPEIPFEDCILYRLHVRGFTRHASSGVENRGTFAGIAEKISYLKDLGVTTLELLPAVEFQEVMVQTSVDRNPYRKEETPSGKVNYWGFVPGLSFAPKASYCAGKEKEPERELKDLVKALHREGMELVMDFFFTGQEAESSVLDVLRFWAREYHVDGFHLIGYAPAALVGKDPYLSRVKIFASSWEGVNGGAHRHLAEYNEGFCNDMRRYLKGDEDMLNALVNRTKRNPSAFGVVNYMANTNGFTLMDMVSYDRKHNEANGENNQDGCDYNYSWNCGVEGPTRKKKVVQMRRKLLRNAFLLTFLSQGTPLLLAGDEFGNSGSGNNNAYCQDNEISWLNWSQAKTNKDILEFVKGVIRLRKDHPIFHMAQEPRNMDYKSLGMPDVSYHGVKAWCPEFENFRRQLGILYCGPYAKKADGSTEDYFFVAYNMHWEPHDFSLPNLPKGMRWFIAVNTDASEESAICQPGKELFLEKQKQYLIPPRTIVVFMGKSWEEEEEKKGKGGKNGKHNKSGKRSKSSKSENSSKGDKSENSSSGSVQITERKPDGEMAGIAVSNGEPEGAEG